MDRDRRIDCSNVTESDRYSEDRRERWRYWRCRHGGDSRDPEPTTTTTSCDNGSQPTSVPLPDPTNLSGQTPPYTGYSQTDIDGHTDSLPKSALPKALIAGIVSGVTVLILLGLALWWLLRRRRRSRQVQSPSPKHSMKSLEQQQQQTPPESPETHQMNLGQEHTRESAYLIPFPPKAATKHATDKSLCAISTASLPIPLPTFPSPKPRERKLSTNNNGINGSSSSVPYYDTNPFPLQSSVIISELSDASVTPNDFYIDMIGLDTSKGPSNSNLRLEASSNITVPLPTTPTSPRAATPTIMSAPIHPSYSPIPPPLSSRSRSSSIASLRKHSETARVTGASHKLSRDARQMVQQFPPPPPPPQVPPPAIPDEAALCQALYAARSPRSRAATTAFEGKEPLSQYWSPTPTGSRPSSIVSTGKSGAPFKGKKSSSRSTSLTRKAIDPLQGPSSPEPYPLPPSLYSYPPQDGGARDKKSLRSHRRSQSNIYGGGSTSSLDEQDRFQGSISPVQLCPPSRPILRHNHSYTGQSSDTNQDVEEIISGALAITAAKKQTEGSPTLSVPSSQDKRSYI